MSTTAQLSVVIASVSGSPYLAACLDDLSRQEGTSTIEILVADRLGAEVSALMQSRFPEARLLSFDRSTGVGELRAEAIRAAKGAVVAVLGDYCTPTSNWCREVLRAHARFPHLAIGGAVDKASTENLVDQVAFLCEYSAFVSPVAEGEVDDLPGPNVAYKRRLFDDAPELLENGYWEILLHRQLLKQGHALRSEPRICVLHRKRYRLGEYSRARYHFSRAFAAARNQRGSVPRRLVHLLGAPVLPLLLSARVARRILRHQTVGRCLQMAPLIVFFMILASAGEWMGYAFGPGRSMTEFN